MVHHLTLVLKLLILSRNLWFFHVNGGEPLKTTRSSALAERKKRTNPNPWCSLRNAWFRLATGTVTLLSHGRLRQSPQRWPPATHGKRTGAPRFPPFPSWILLLNDFCCSCLSKSNATKQIASWHFSLLDLVKEVLILLMMNIVLKDFGSDSS